MSNDRQVVGELFADLVRKTAEAGIPEDVVGRLLLGEVVALWREKRSIDDIRSELTFIGDNLDPDTDYAFMRP